MSKKITYLIKLLEKYRGHDSTKMLFLLRTLCTEGQGGTELTKHIGFLHNKT